MPVIRIKAARKQTAGAYPVTVTMTHKKNLHEETAALAKEYLALVARLDRIGDFAPDGDMAELVSQASAGISKASRVFTMELENRTNAFFNKYNTVVRVKEDNGEYWKAGDTFYALKSMDRFKLLVLDPKNDRRSAMVYRVPADKVEEVHI